MKCFHRFDPSFQRQPSASNTSNAYYAAPDGGNNSEWLMDSGASNHVIPDPTNFGQKYDYNGGEKLVIENGQGLNISHTGLSNISLPTGHITLKSMLHVPSITKNLLSVAKLTNDNNVTVEFNSRFVFVKDKVSKRFYCKELLKMDFTKCCSQACSLLNLGISKILALIFLLLS